MQNHKCALFIAAGLSAVAYPETPPLLPPQPPVMEEYTLQRLEQIQAETGPAVSQSRPRPYSARTGRELY